MSSYPSVSPDRLSRLIGTAKAPTLVDVRLDEHFASDPRLIPGAISHSHLDVKDSASRLNGQSVVVVYQKGQKLAEGTAAWLGDGKIAALFVGDASREPVAAQYSQEERPCRKQSSLT